MIKHQPLQIVLVPNVMESNQRLEEEQAAPETSTKTTPTKDQEKDPEIHTPSLELALDRVRKTTGQYFSNKTVNMSSNIQQFQQFGPGIYLYFSFIKKTMLLFLVLSIVNLLSIIYNRIAGESYFPTAWGLNTQFAKTTLGAHSATASNQHFAKIFNEVIVAITLTILFVFWLYWKHHLITKIVQLDTKGEHPSSSTIQVQDIPNDVTQNHVKLFMEKFGKIRQIVKVIHKGETLFLAKQITKINQELHLLQLRRRHQSCNFVKISQQIISKTKTKQKLKQQLRTELQQLNQRGQQVIVRYFVQFQTHQSQINLLKLFQKHQKCCCCCTVLPQQLLIEGKQLTIVNCQSQPEEIYWQNQNIGIKQTLLPNILLLLFVNIVAVTTIILIALLSASTEPVYYNPSLSTNILSSSDIMKQNDNKALASWCLSNDYKLHNDVPCQYFVQLQSSRMLIYFTIASIIIIARYAIKHIILAMRPYLRFKNKSQQSQTIMFHLFINYSIVSVLMVLAMQSNLFGSTIGKIVQSCVKNDGTLLKNLQLLHQYFDYTPQWYLQYGFQLTINLALTAFFPHVLTPFADKLINKVKLYLAQKQTTQHQMEKLLTFNQFQMEDHYASTFMIIFVGLLFSGALPVLIPLVFIALLVKLMVAKYLFLYSNKVTKFNHYFLAMKTTNILFIAITVYLINALWAFGCEYVFKSESTLFSDRGLDKDSNGHDPIEAFMVFFRRLTCTWPLFMIYVIGVLTISFSKIFSGFTTDIVQKTKTHQNNAKIGRIQPYIESSIDKKANEMELNSYKPQKNLSYKKVWQELRQVIL